MAIPKSENVLQPPCLMWFILAFLLVTQNSCSLISSTSDALINQVSLAPPYHIENPTAHQFHQSLFVADLHADTLLWDRDLLERYERGHLDVPRMIEGNIALSSLYGFFKDSPSLSSLDVNSLARNLLLPTRT